MLVRVHWREEDHAGTRRTGIVTGYVVTDRDGTCAIVVVDDTKRIIVVPIYRLTAIGWRTEIKIS